MPETLTTCPICQSDKLRKMQQNGFLAPYCICKSCGQYFTNPRMTDDEVTAYYQGEYWTRMSRDDSGINVNNFVRHRERARNQVLTFADHLRPLTSCLEIGCSAGYLIDYLHTMYGMEVIGVEPDTRHHAVHPAREYRLYTDVSLVPARKFDLLAMSHSLEHFNHPLEYLTALVARFAHDDTRLLIEVPNIDAPHPTMISDRHPFAFGEVTLNQLLARVGYKPLEIVTHGLNGVIPRYLLGMYSR